MLSVFVIHHSSIWTFHKHYLIYAQNDCVLAMILFPSVQLQLRDGFLKKIKLKKMYWSN